MSNVVVPLTDESTDNVFKAMLPAGDLGLILKARMPGGVPAVIEVPLTVASRYYLDASTLANVYADAEERWVRLQDWTGSLSGLVAAAVHLAQVNQDALDVQAALAFRTNATNLVSDIAAHVGDSVVLRSGTFSRIVSILRQLAIDNGSGKLSDAVGLGATLALGNILQSHTLHRRHRRSALCEGSSSEIG